MTVNHARAFSTKNATADFLPKMALHRSNQLVIVDLCLAPSKDLLLGKSFKKETLAWKLITLVIIALCGLSLCFVRAGQRNLLLKAGYYTQKTAPRIQCPGNSRNSTEGFQLHYPRPNNFEREECACTPVHYFVILSMQRSGSGWFETLLNNHPTISSHGEIFAGRDRHTNFSVISRKLDEVYNLDYSSSAVKDGCTSAVGFKWMLNQGVMEYHKEIALYFKERGVSVIFLLRWNLLRRLVSILANAYDREMKLLNGTHKSHVHSKQEADTLATYKPTINHEGLPASFRHILEVTQDALKIFNNTRHTIVYYEDLVKNKERLDQIQEFLGVSPISLESQQVKIHTRPLSEQIENWDLVYKTLKGTEFEEFLAENEYV